MEGQSESVNKAPGVYFRLQAPEVALSIVVPAYNEDCASLRASSPSRSECKEYRIPQMLDETLSYLESRGAEFSYEAGAK